MNAILPQRDLAGRVGAASQTRRGVLTVALVNNMPDAGMIATERQFAALLSSASEGLTVRLKLYAWPGLSRSAPIQERIAAHYEEFEALEANPPDGLIVTGTEPKADHMDNEPLWPLFRRLTDWAETARIPTIWSCMAAHAAVWRLGGPHRERLPAKLSGLFRCRTRRSSHPLARALPPATHFVPHSRYSGLSPVQLRKAGFDIVSDGAEAGADIFATTGRAPHLFLQGHPEYGPTTLLAEYRRDLARFLNRERDRLPAPPAGYYGQAIRARLAALEEAARENPDPAQLAAFDAAILDLAPRHDWAGNAVRLYRGWLHSLQPAPRRLPLWRFSSTLRDTAASPIAGPPIAAGAMQPALSRAAFTLAASKLP